MIAEGLQYAPPGPGLPHCVPSTSFKYSQSDQMITDDFYLKLPGNVDVLIPDLLGPVVPGQYLLLQIRMILRLKVLVSMISDCILNTFLNTLILLKP